MSTIYTTEDGQDQFWVTGRHVRPITDELMLTIQRGNSQRSIVLSREQVHQLHETMGDWLELGWPHVRRTRGPIPAYNPDGAP